MAESGTLNMSDKSSTHRSFDVDRIRADFPILIAASGDQPLVYLDNAATTQKPTAVIEAVRRYYEMDNANVHRGVHRLSVRATESYERARAKVGRFLSAGRVEEIVFVRGTTEAINLVAQSFVRPTIQAGDEIIISAMEHHANIVPWQILCKQTEAVLRVVPMNDHGELLLDEYERLLGPRTRFVSIGHVSNALGTINPVEDMIRLAHDRGIAVMLDGAQGVPHQAVDVVALDCDFYAFSGHKAFAPTGIGVLYAKADLLNDMPPYQGGGDMIKSVTFDETIYNDIPYKFEAGTPNIAGAIGLGAAIDYIEDIGMDVIAAQEADLLEYATRRLGEIPEIRLIGTAAKKAAVVSFVIEGIHPHDVGTILDQKGIAIRTGHHCAQPVMQHFGVPATARASFAFYDTKAEIDALVRGVGHVLEVFR
jgi:cysteine desulfurase / selenocysteine lyase